MTAKHTPGPWKFERSADYEHMMQTLGKPCEEHAGYFRDNDGTWGIAGLWRGIVKQVQLIHVIAVLPVAAFGI